MTTNFKTNNTAVETAYCSYAYIRFSNLWGFGYNGFGQLGNLSTTDQSSPVQVSSTNTPEWKSIATGSSHSLGIKYDGTLWSWGYGGYGALGQGDLYSRYSPVQVGSSTWSVMSGGTDNYGYSLGIQSDGSIWACGSNSGGQLGQSDTTNRSTFTQIGSLKTWSKVYTGNYSLYSGHVLAIKTDGTLWAWGENGIGQLGLGDTTNRSSPVQVGTLTTWLSATAGAGASLAIKTDGTLWAWGYNYYGQLGDGTNVSKSSPVQVGTLTTWSSVSTGGYALGSTLAIKADGTLWAWGHNGTGQLGLGDGAWRSSPVQVGALTTWSKVYAGAYHTLAIKTDGTLWAWGDNTRGELGQGDNTTRYSPVQVGSMTYWSSASSGPYVTGGVMIGGWSMALQNAYVDP